MTDTAKITLRVVAPPMPQARRRLNLLFASALQIAVVGVGVWVGSPAMQWLGALVWFAILMVFASSSVNNRSGLTIDQARHELNRIERDTP